MSKEILQNINFYQLFLAIVGNLMLFMLIFRFLNKKNK